MPIRRQILWVLLASTAASATGSVPGLRVTAGASAAVPPSRVYAVAWAAWEHGDYAIAPDAAREAAWMGELQACRFVAAMYDAGEGMPPVPPRAPSGPAPSVRRSSIPADLPPSRPPAPRRPGHARLSRPFTFFTSSPHPAIVGTPPARMVPAHSFSIIRENRPGSVRKR